MPRTPAEKMILAETAGSILWFAMDGCWMLNQAFPAKAVALPALAVNLLAFRYSERTLSQISVVGAMIAWLLMNIFWMWGDLDKDPRPLLLARVLFVVGMALLAVALAGEGFSSEGLTKVLARFRRLRM